MSLNLPICHACNTTLSRKQRTSITENVTNPPYLGAQLKKCDLVGENRDFYHKILVAQNISVGGFVLTRFHCALIFALCTMHMSNAVVLVANHSALLHLDCGMLS